MTTLSRGDVPQLADGVDLIGRYKNSAYVTPRYLVKRGDGSIVQLAELLFTVTSEIDGHRTFDEVAARVTDRAGRTVTPDNIAMIAERKLRPLGVLADADGSSPPVEPLAPLLGLTGRVGLVPERLVQRVARTFRPLFAWPIVLAAVIGLAAVDVWLVFVEGIGQGARQAFIAPLAFLFAVGVIVVGAAFHEVGHASGAAAGGARPGRMGAGLYLAWPAFFTDVTDAYRLSRRGRLRTDFGGIYFTGLMALGLVGLYGLTGWAPLLAIVFLLQVEIVHQMLPLLRLDGYYVLADITGVPDLFRRIGPILRSALPGREPAGEVRELKPWARRFVTGWVLVVVPFLLTNMLLVVLSLPRLLSTAAASFQRLANELGPATAAGRFAVVLQMVALAIPVLGILITMARLVRRFGRRLSSWAAGNRRRRLVLALLAVVGIGVLVPSLWPDQDWRPYGPDERGTLGERIASVVHVGRGSPALGAAALGPPQLIAAGSGPSGPADGQPRTDGNPGPAAPAQSASGTMLPAPDVLPPAPARGADWTPAATRPSAWFSMVNPLASPPTTTAPIALTDALPAWAPGALQGLPSAPTVPLPSGGLPVGLPSGTPTAVPSLPVSVPSGLPSSVPSQLPTGLPTQVPTSGPTQLPSGATTRTTTPAPSTVPTKPAPTTVSTSGTGSSGSGGGVQTPAP